MIGGNGILRYQGSQCIPNIDGFMERIMIEVHGSKYTIHPDSMKMYHYLREFYWWSNMKWDVAGFWLSVWCVNE